MKSKSKNFDLIWEKKYSEGHVQLYPWDLVVSFIFNYLPNNPVRSKIKILELGFGTGSNLWFAAREGFSVHGVEASSSAVSFAKNRFKSDSLVGDLRVGNFTELPFDNEYFDLIIDRCSLTCVGATLQKKTIQETKRVLKKEGKFLHNTYGKNHSSIKSGEKGKDGLTLNIKKGSLAGSGQLCFNSESEIKKKFDKGWKLLELQKREHVGLLTLSKDLHEEWLIIAEKI